MFLQVFLKISIRYHITGRPTTRYLAIVAAACPVRLHIATLSPDAHLADVLTTYSTTIDAVAWLGLVFLFELETYALPDAALKKWVTTLLRAARIACYVSIGYAAYGYTTEALENYDTKLIDGLTNVCQVADQGVFMQTNSIDYIEITETNCDSLSDETVYFQIADDVSIVPESVALHAQQMGWFDIVNAFVWLAVVVLIEIEVWMQSHGRFSSRLLTAVRVAKTLLYLELIANGMVWAITGYPLYSWDAFLWIFGFWAIELNLAEWERDRIEELQVAP